MVSRSRSSPPARGCSHRMPPTRGQLLVVPARAGVLLLAGGDRRTSSSRPRPRGGAPRRRRMRAALQESSPPARGCSRPGRGPDTALRVVPARAGVLRRACRRRSCPGVVPARAGVLRGLLPGPMHRPRRPRPRGGAPGPRALLGVVRRSSPPARGCSRSCSRVTAAAAGRPRPRGGAPEFTTAGRRRSCSRPRPRGGAPEFGRRSASWSAVVPAHAGVLRRVPMASWTQGCRPRPRGGAPARAARWRRRSVVPAHAGVLHAHRREHTGPGRPRPRGGAPGRARRRGRVSPVVPAHAGVPDQPCPVAVRVAVVPARAGELRPYDLWPVRTRGRPRPRGGAPPARPPTQPRCGSSPPARGCSDRPPRPPRRQVVVPARAGVLRHRADHFCRLRVVPARAGVLRSASSSPTTPAVVPARAGVLRPQSPRAHRRRRPRPRGGAPRLRDERLLRCGSSPPARGCSVVGVRADVAVTSSPPARGCSHRQGHGHRGPAVVPARAGVLRSGAPRRR